MTPSVIADHVAPFTIPPIVATYAAPAIASGRAMTANIAANNARESPKNSMAKQTPRVISGVFASLTLPLKKADVSSGGSDTGKSIE